MYEFVAPRVVACGAIRPQRGSLMHRLRVLAILTLAASSLTLAPGPPALAWIDPGTQPNVPPKKNFAAEASLSADGREV